MPDQVVDSIVAGAWPRAFALALEAWRTYPDPELADVLDVLGEGVASAPSSVDARFLAKHESLLAGERDRHAAAIAEVAMELGRDADPRSARRLVAWLVEMPWSWNHRDVAISCYGRIADRLISLRDVRVVASLAPLVSEPRAKTEHLRQLQSVLARQVCSALAKVKPPPKRTARQFATWAAALPAKAELPERAKVVRDNGLSALWANVVAADRDDTTPRLALADALIRAKDPRGEIISLACAGTAASQREADALLTRHWATIFGDLSLVLHRSTCSFHLGMLDVASVGTRKAPAWAYAKVRGHRELATVRLVRNHHASPRDYVAFLSHVRAPRIALDDIEMLSWMQMSSCRWPHVQCLELGFEPDRLDVVAAALPALVEVHVASGIARDSLADAHALWPGLRVA